MKRKLWWRLAGVGAMTLLFIWYLIPQFSLLDDGFQWSDMLDVLRPGIDLAGGTRLVYQVKTENWSGGTRGTPAETMIEALKKRIDPTGTKNLTWRPVGSDRIEIEIPRATPSAMRRAERYKKVADGLLATNVRLGDLKPL